MPISDIQDEVLRTVARNRTAESYLAGATVLHRSANSPRYSQDLDFFHDVQDSVARSAEQDAATLQAAGFSVEWLLRTGTFYRAVVTVRGRMLKIEWAQDSAFRFFPVVEDEQCGYRLHEADAAVNKVLALAGRSEVRDFVDVVHLHETYLSLGALAWAACGKDPGFSPLFLLDQAGRHTAHAQADVDRLSLRKPLDGGRLKRKWLAALEDSRRLVGELPAEELGFLFLPPFGTVVTIRRAHTAFTDWSGRNKAWKPLCFHTPRRTRTKKISPYGECLCTIDLLLSGPKSMQAERRQKHIARKRKPATVRARLPHRRPTVGIRLPVWAGSTARVLDGIAGYMRNHGYWHIETPNDSYGEMERVEITRDWQGDGLILYRATAEELADFRKRGIAVVLLSTEGTDAGYPRVLPDNDAAGRAAAAHLMELGHESFAYLARGDTLYREAQFISGPRVYSRERLAGYRAALEVNDFHPRDHMLPGFPLWKRDTWKEVERAVAEFLAELPRPTGLFAADDALAAVVLRAAERRDIAVPQALSVIGFGNDVNLCHASIPALSSIPYPALEVGYRAATELARQLAGEVRGDEGDKIRIAPEPVHRRESTDFLAIADAETERLVRWIRKTAPHLAIRIQDLLEQTSYSHNTVKTRFRKHLGHSPKKEISRVRRAHLSFLLDDPSLSLKKIASLMQFASTHELGRFFLKETGERPGAYRERKRSSRLGRVAP